MADGFGTAARPWAARLPADLALVAADFPRSPAALARVAARKRSGKSIAATLFLPELRTLVASSNAAKILAQAPDYDRRYSLFSGLAAEQLESNGVSQRDWIKFDVSLIAAAREFISACDIWVARSATEVARISAAVSYFPDTILRAAPLDPLVPAAPQRTPGRRRGVVVWAPNATRDECALFAFGLDALRVPITILCREPGPPFPQLRARFLPAVANGALLAQAAVIVDASVDDPGSTLALACYGVPLLAATTSGAHEWLAPLQLYAPWSTRSIFDAALTALGASAPKPLQPTDGVGAIRSELDAADEALPQSGPLVSIVIPTYNRREHLRSALQSVANQRYATVEMVVVNDGGEAIADIVTSFPRARLIENEHNLGVTPSVNAGIAAARGEYLCFLADDDFLQPDHVARLVAALECSKADVAHSKELALHHELQPDGSYNLCGHHIGAPIPTHPDDILVTNRIGGPSLMVRRRALDAVGSFDTAMRHGSDFEMWMRLSRSRDFVFVNHVTAHLSMRNDNSQLSSVSGAETAEIMKRIYVKHPVAARPLLEAGRTQTLTVCAQQSVVRSAPVRVLNDDDLRELQIG